jgi:mannose-6-phosphate isomerase-like protein (cupin superfamily)
MRFPPVLCVLTLAVGCSRTAPDTKWPPPGPILPVAPMPEDGFESEESEDAPATPPAPGKGSGKPTPVDGSLPATPPTLLFRHHACAQKECKLTTYLPDAAFAKAAPGGEDSPAAIWAQEISEQSTLFVPRHHKLELLVVALAGTTQVGLDEGGAAKPLGTWDVLRAPGAGVTLRSDKGSAKLVLALVATQGSLQEALTLAKDKPFMVRWLKRPRPVVSASLESQKDLAWGGGAFHARIAFGGAEPPIAGSWELLKASDNATIAEHDHPTWEHIAILEGSGTMQIGGKNEPVKSGSVFDIPPGVKHAFTPSGKKGLLAIQTYTPSGPEQRFVKLAAESK